MNGNFYEPIPNLTFGSTLVGGKKDPLVVAFCLELGPERFTTGEGLRGRASPLDSTGLEKDGVFI